MRYSLRSPFEHGPPGRRRFRDVPVRTMVPNVITLLALCAGLTAIRLAAEGTFEWAVYAIVFAAVLDGIDARAGAAAPNGQVPFGGRARQPRRLREFRRRACRDAVLLEPA